MDNNNTMRTEYNKEIKHLAEKYKRTEEDREIRELLTGQLYVLINKSEKGEIGMADFTEELEELASQAGFFMRLIK